MMDFKFSDGLDYRVRSLPERLPSLIEEIPALATQDTDLLRDVVENLHVRVTGDPTWTFEMNRWGILFISKKAIELLWASAYGHVAIYNRVFAGKQISGDVDIEGDPELTLPRQMLTWCKDENAIDGFQPFPDAFPVPMFDAPLTSTEGLAAHVALHSVLFHTLHEISHAAFGRRGLVMEQIIEEERACDFRAIDWILTRRECGKYDRVLCELGAATGLLFVAAYGIDTGRHDGIRHPRTYDRLVDTLGRRFRPDHDTVWGLAVAILAAHASNQKIPLAKEAIPPDGFSDFYSCALAYRDAIHRSA